MDGEYILGPNGELYHHGTKGMRWGIRRYQNKDGSLTPAGRKRYAAENEKLKAREKAIKGREKAAARQAKLDAKKAELDAREAALKGGKTDTKQKNTTDNTKNNSAKPKSAKDMTDDELARAIARARAEDEFNRLRPAQVSSKSGFAKKFLDEAVKPALISSGRKALEDVMNKTVKNLLKDKIDPNSLEALKATYEKLDYKHKIDKLQNPDKYLSEEDKTKRQDREFKAEDRAARKEGYQDAADKAVKTREAEEAARKARADEDARAANNAKSKEYYDSVYNRTGGEKEYFNPNESRGLVLYNNPNTNIASVRPAVQKYHDTPVTSLSTSIISSGKSKVDEYFDFVVTDKNGEVLRVFNQDDDVFYKRDDS